MYITIFSYGHTNSILSSWEIHIIENKVIKFFFAQDSRYIALYGDYYKI